MMDDQVFNKGIYFRGLKLKNIRCFGEEEQTIDFTDAENKTAQWNIIIGDNGVGKTTLLRALAYVETDLIAKARMPFGHDYFFRTSTTSTKERKSGYISYQRSGHWSESAHRDPNIYNKLNKTSYIQASLISPNSSEAKHLGGLAYSTQHLFQLFGYGAARRIGDSSISTNTPSPISKNDDNYYLKTAYLFNDNLSLTNAEEWLLRSDYAALKSKDPKLEKQTKKILDLLLQLFEGFITNIKIESNPAHVLFQTDYGWVKLHDLNLGYKTLIAWMVDFASKLFAIYPKSKNPLAEPAILLIDEIDLHLHPRFQRNLLDFLTKTFPNTQFIVTAHSPLILQANVNPNIILLKKQGDQVIVDRNPINIQNWRVDQILTSELFGLQSTQFYHPTQL